MSFLIEQEKRHPPRVWSLSNKSIAKLVQSILSCSVFTFDEKLKKKLACANSAFCYCSLPPRPPTPTPNWMDPGVGEKVGHPSTKRWGGGWWEWMGVTSDFAKPNRKHWNTPISIAQPPEVIALRCEQEFAHFAACGGLGEGAHKRIACGNIVDTIELLSTKYYAIKIKRRDKLLSGRSCVMHTTPYDQNLDK